MKCYDCAREGRHDIDCPTGGVAAQMDARRHVLGVETRPEIEPDKVVERVPGNGIPGSTPDDIDAWFRKNHEEAMSAAGPMWWCPSKGIGGL